MVKSGLESRVSVAPERLAIHLGLALILFCALIWTAMEAWSGQPRAAAGAHRRPGRLASMLFFGLVFFQCLLGALVAGNQAGLIDNDWPLMNGYLVPARLRARTALGDAGAQPGGRAVQPPHGRLRGGDRRRGHRRLAA